MGKTILMIHGRHFKPAKDPLQQLWIEAVRWGIERDHPDKLAAFDSVHVELIYYGDYSNAFPTTANTEMTIPRRRFHSGSRSVRHLPTRR